MIAELDADKRKMRTILEAELAQAKARGEAVDPAEVDAVVGSLDSWTEMYRRRELTLGELAKVIDWELRLIRFILAAHDLAHDPQALYRIFREFTRHEKANWLRQPGRIELPPEW